MNFKKTILKQKDVAIESALIIQQTNDFFQGDNINLQFGNENQGFENVEHSPDKNKETQMSMQPIYCSANISVIGKNQSKETND